MSSVKRNLGPALIVLGLALILLSHFMTGCTSVTPTSVEEAVSAPTAKCEEIAHSLYETETAAGRKPATYMKTPVGEMVVFTDEAQTDLHAYFLAWDARVADALLDRGWTHFDECLASDDSTSIVMLREIGSGPEEAAK